MGRLPIARVSCGGTGGVAPRSFPFSLDSSDLQEMKERD